jgi:hypothetical protein
MVNTAFANYLEATLKGNSLGRTSFTELPERYPYFYVGHVLALKQLKANSDLAFTDELRITSLMSPNREHLKNLIEDTRKVQEEEIKIQETQSTRNLTEPLPETVFEINLEPAVLEQIEDYPVLEEAEKKPDIPTPITIDEFRAEKKTFSAWLKKVGIPKEKEQAEPQEQTTTDREVLIRKFIDTEPQISKTPKASFYSAVEMARKSTEERDDIVSETLAGIYLQQGDTARAMRIYQKLCLLYPEKSSYFAALIQKLNTNI